MTVDPMEVPTSPSPFLDAEGGKVIPRLPWLTPRRLVFFLIFWITVFFAGSIFVENPFVGGSGTSNWWVGSVNYWWVVMYLHGLTVGLVGLLALVACDALEIPSLAVRKGIMGGVLVAGILAPIGGVFDRTPPWTNAAMWVQVGAFVALDEIALLLLWGILEQWRAGAPISRTFPFVLAALCGGSVLVSAVMAHLAGWIMTFGDYPTAIGWYASQQGETVQVFADNLALSHAYLMVVTLMAGIVALAAIRFGYYGLKGRTRTLARVGMALMCVSVPLEVELAILSGFTPWTLATPSFITSINGLNWVGINDLVTLVTLTFGGFLVLGALVIGGGRLQGFARGNRVLVRVTPFLAWVVFAAMSAALEPPGGVGIGPPVFAWIRLYIGFVLLLVLMVVMLVVERLVPARYHSRVVWTAIVGVTFTFVGSMIYIYTALPDGGYLAVVGLLAIGLSFLFTIWYGAPRPDASRNAVFLTEEP